ncbi:hypothetical protein VUR80DRAFT_8181 [Thermomyces stellatus]
MKLPIAILLICGSAHTLRTKDASTCCFAEGRAGVVVKYLARPAETVRWRVMVARKMAGLIRGGLCGSGRVSAPSARNDSTSKMESRTLGLLVYRAPRTDSFSYEIARTYIYKSPYPRSRVLPITILWAMLQPLSNPAGRLDTQE